MVQHNCNHKYNAIIDRVLIFVPHRSIALRLCRHSDGDITKNHLISGNKLLISSYTYVTDSSQGVPLFVL